MMNNRQICSIVGQIQGQIGYLDILRQILLIFWRKSSTYYLLTATCFREEAVLKLLCLAFSVKFNWMVCFQIADQIAPPKLLPNFVEYSPQLHKHLRCLLNCFLCFENRQSRHSGKSFCCQLRASLSFSNCGI